MSTTDPIEIRDLIMRDVLHGDVMKPFLTDDAVVNAAMWRFLQTGVGLLAAGGLLTVPETPDATPTPLDPAAVKAGDTVTIVGDAAKVEGKVHAVFMEDALVFEIGYSHFKVSGADAWTLTAHQPAPKPEWKPGTVGTAGTVRGLGYTGPVVRTDEHLLPWWTPSRVDGAHYHGEDTVTDFVPDEPRPLPTRDEVRKAVWHAAADDALVKTIEEVTDAVLALLRGESR